MSRFALRFVVLLGALFAAELTRPAQEALVIPWTEGLARLSAALATLVDANVGAHAKLLYARDTGFAVSIEAGCNGIEAALILIAAMLCCLACCRRVSSRGISRLRFSRRWLAPVALWPALNRALFAPWLAREAQPAA